MALAGERESVVQQLRPRPAAAHPAAEIRVVLAAVARRANQRHHVLGTLRQVLIEPLAKQCLELVRQAQQYIAGADRTGRGDRGEDALDL